MTEMQMQKELAKWHSESFGWALRCCAGDRIMAEDALQTVYLKILEGRALFKGKSSFKTWLFSVIRFTVIDAQRKQKSKRQQMEKVQEELVRQSTATNSAEVEYDSKKFKAALASLSEKQSEVLQLVFYHDCSITEAAEIMNIGVGSARKHYARGKENLRKKLIQLELIKTES
jgi:RNA polymerase sigma factor (sigma-70 family)